MRLVLIVLITLTSILVPTAEAADGTTQQTTEWKTPPEEVMKVLHAAQLPRVDSAIG